MTVLMFSVLATLASAEEAEEKNPIVDSYTDEEGNFIIVLEDGTEYVVEGEKVVETEETEISIDFNPKRMVFSLQFMWKGMLCIFIVIAVLILSVYGMNKLTNLPAFNKKED